MKNILTIALIALMAVFAGCSKDNDKEPFKIKDTDMISIRPAQSVKNAKVETTDTHLSALEIVKQTTQISYIYNQTGKPIGRSFADEQRDIISNPPRLLMWATDVITLDGQLQTEWIETYDVVLEHYEDATPHLRDTIAYIPNSVLRAAEASIKEAYQAKNLEACYKIFNEAYTFTPITGPEWRALKATGQN